jgi:hypothetical protein
MPKAASKRSTPARLPLRPPAVPLVTHDPFFSVWSFADRLTDGWTRHWTGHGQSMCGLARIDRKTYRFAGAPDGVEAMEQTSLVVWPTRTIYTFTGGGVELTLTFLTPALLDDLDLLSRPVTYVTFDVRSIDGKRHDVTLYFDIGAEWSVNSAGDKVTWSRYRAGGLCLLRAAAAEQKMLDRSGDDHRIEWGSLYLAVPSHQPHIDAMGTALDVRGSFIASGKLPAEDDLNMPRQCTSAWPVLAASFDLGKVDARGTARWLMLAYDDQFSIEFLHRRLRPYWARAGAGIADILKRARDEYDDLRPRCEAFDVKLVRDLRAAGGAMYAEICILAYRQSLAAHKLVADLDGRPLYFSKENFSNGCIATVDVTYPSAPLYLLLNPTLLEGMLTPVLEYALTPRWRFEFAPHDLGQYPLANGQVYGGGETSEKDQMPVEECGNMLILVAALVKFGGDIGYARRYWPLLRKWAVYLSKKGMDPENQLCTDDFAGHLAHNCNLSIKAIVGLAAFAQLARAAGEPADARRFMAEAKRYAAKWKKLAADDGHTRLAFDRPGTWSQKYNLVWDRLLGLNLFDPSIARREIRFYLTKQLRYGLPLDSRKTYTKIDWTIWTATLAESREDFDALIEPLYRWLNETPSRVPLCDWHETTDGKQVGFQARSVVGGLFIKLLAEKPPRGR